MTDYKKVMMSVRLTEEDKRRLNAIAKADRRTPPDMLRVLVNIAYENLPSEQQ